MLLQAFRETCGEIFITPNNAQVSFLTSIQSLFSDGVVNWGRVVALLAFSGALAAQCVEKEMPFLGRRCTTPQMFLFGDQTPFEVEHYIHNGQTHIHTGQALTLSW